MCLHPHPVDPVPEETARVARAAFPRGNTYMTMRDELGAIFSDEDFTHLFPERGRPAFSPWRLALVTIMAFAEGLSDRQAADAVRGRIDYKYALSLELTDPGFDASVLCEFRARLSQGGREETVFDTLLYRFREMGLLKVRGRQRTDSTYVLACARSLNRLELVGETMRQALSALAVAAPGWLRHHADPEWASRYGLPADDRRLPKGEERRREEAEKIGAEGFGLLEAIYSDGPDWLAEIPAVETMRKVWVQDYLQTPEGMAWRTSEDGLPPAATRIDSPTDPECHSSRGKTIGWLGYKVHFTETCDEGYPNLITNVETTTAPIPDTEATPVVHRELEAKELLPATHLVDKGYMDARWLLEARRDYGVDLLGPVRGNYSRQAQEDTGFDLSAFEIDWEKMEATCPEGRKSVRWRQRYRRGQPILGIVFSPTDCGVCPSRDLCIRSNPSRRNGQPRRELTVTSKEHYEALRIARRRESTAEYGREHARREGIEGTVSRTVRTCGVRRCRYRGLKKVHLGHVLTAASVNFLRVGEWISPACRPPSNRSSPFVRLMERSAA